MSGSKPVEPSPKLELRLNLSSLPSASESKSGSGSCVSLAEMRPEEASSTAAAVDDDGHVSCGGGTEEGAAGGGTVTTMRLLGCQRCHMYVMLAADVDGPRCPKCRSSDLLDFLNTRGPRCSNSTRDQ